MWGTLISHHIMPLVIISLGGKHTCTHISTCTHILTQVYACTHAHMHTHTHTHTLTHTHKHTHTHKSKFKKPGVCWPKTLGLKTVRPTLIL